MLTWVNSAWMGLAALVAVPLLAHLVSRTRPPVFPFSDTRFLEKVVKRTLRVRRPRDWMMLALRTLAVALLVTGFLRPVLVSSQAVPAGEGSTWVLVIDASASMAAPNQAGTRFARAQAEAARLLDAAPPGAMVNVVWMRGRPEAILPEPAPNIDYVRDRISAGVVRPEPAAIEEAIRQAGVQLAKGRGRRQLFVISDFQASAWREAKRAWPAGARTEAVPVADQTPPNLAVTRLTVEPASPVPGQSVQVTARVANHSGDPRRTALTLAVGGGRETRDLEIPPWGEAEAIVPVKLTTPGETPVGASLPEDAFPDDNARHGVIVVRESLRLAITGTPSGGASDILRRVDAALPWLDLAAPGSPADLEFVVRCNGSNPKPDDLLAAARAGRGLLVQPSGGVDANVLASLGGSVVPGAGTSCREEAKPDPGWTLAVADEAHPALALFSKGEFGNPFGGRATRRLVLPADLTGFRPLARYADGIPALLQSAKDPLAIWNLPLDPADGTWTARSAFLPFFGEFLLSLAVRPPPFPDHLPGDSLAWVAPDTVDPLAVQLFGPDGKSASVEAVRGERGLELTCASADRLGLFRWVIDQRTVHHEVVNFPTAESDLRTLDPATLPFTATIQSAQIGRLAALRDGLPLAPWLFGGGLLILLVELALARWWMPRPASS